MRIYQVLIVLFLFFILGCDKEENRTVEEKENTEEEGGENYYVSGYHPDTNAPKTYKELTLVWNEEFDVDGLLDTSDWNFWMGKHGRRLQHYQDSNTTISDGVLIIEARRETVENVLYDPGSTNPENSQYADYTSAQITTEGKHDFKFGRLEVRAKTPTQKGAWPAIWTMGVKDQWPANGEIDIFELYLKKGEPVILANFAWQSSAGEWIASWDTYIDPLTKFTDADPDWVKKYHIWRMDWDENTISIYLDGILLNTINSDQANETTEFGEIKYPFLQKHYLLLNLAIGLNGGNPENTTFPLYYYIDYVRLYQYNKYQ